jgi:hypothetical protein
VTVRVEARHRVAIAGTVRIAATGEPLAGAVVTLTSGPPEFVLRRDRLAAVHGTAWETLAERPDRARAAPDGLYWFTDLPAGTYVVRATRPGSGGRYGAVAQSATVAVDGSGAVEPAFVDLDVPVTGLAGRVVDAATTHAGMVRAAASLLSRWRLGEASGDAVDDVSHRDAKPSGPMTRAVPGLVVGDADPAAALSGGCFEVPFDPELNPPQFSVEAWVKATGGAGTTRGVVVSRDHTAGALHRGYGLYASDANQWELRIGDGTAFHAVVGPAVVANQTVHLVGTFDGSLARLYVNGALAATSAAIAFAANAARPLRIGAGGTEGPADSPFTGVVDEPAVYGAALSGAAVEASSAAGSSAETQRAVPMASVTLDGSGETAYTDGEGRYTLNGLEPGARMLRIGAPAFTPVIVGVTVAAGSTTIVDAAIARP